jgi:hypothetical protein
VDRIEVELLKAARDLRTMAQARLQNTIAEIADLEEQLHQLRSQRDGELDADRRLRDTSVLTAGSYPENTYRLRSSDLAVRT